MNLKSVSIIITVVTLVSLSLAGISTNIPYAIGSQDDSYKNQGQCMKGEREYGIDKKSFKEFCKNTNFNVDDEECGDIVSGDDPEYCNPPSNEDHQTTPENSG